MVKFHSMVNIIKNKLLLKKYPFLTIYTGWKEEPLTDITWYDFIPEGWCKCFGKQLCDDLLRALKESDMNPKDLHILDIKEKFGELRIYCGGTTDLVDDVLTKYEQLSRSVCIHCGAKNAHMYNYGYILPLCEECATVVNNKKRGEER